MSSGGVKGKAGRAGDTYGNPMTQGHFSQTHVSTQFIQQTLGVDYEEAKDMGYALDKFTGSFYDSIRAAQRNNDVDSDYWGYGEQLETFIQKSPKYFGQGAVYRGIDVTERRASMIIDTLSNGGTIDMGGVSSWSSSLSVAKNFANVGYNQGSNSDRSIVFVLDKGTKAGASIRHVSKFSSEDEVLISKRAKYKATNISVDPDKGYYVIHLSESIAS